MVNIKAESGGGIGLVREDAGTVSFLVRFKAFVKLEINMLNSHQRRSRNLFSRKYKLGVNSKVLHHLSTLCSMMTWRPMNAEIL
jgi:hypothetical protein